MTDYQLRMAKASEADIQIARAFCNQLDDMLQDDIPDEEVIRFLRENFTEGLGMHYDRILLGYDVLISNACDPSLSYLEFKPEIMEAMALYAQAQRLSADVLNQILAAVHDLESFPKTEGISYAGGYGE